MLINHDEHGYADYDGFGKLSSVLESRHHTMSKGGWDDCGNHGYIKLI